MTKQIVKAPGPLVWLNQCFKRFRLYVSLNVDSYVKIQMSTFYFCDFNVALLFFYFMLFSFINFSVVNLKL